MTAVFYVLNELVNSCELSFICSITRKFWGFFLRNVYKVYNSKATKYVNSRGDAVGDCEVAEMWKNNFQRLYSSVDGTSDKHILYDRMKLEERQSIIVFTMSDIFSAVNST